MSDDIIRVGDCVYVAYPMTCCGYKTGSEGTFFIVTKFTSKQYGLCLSCKKGSDIQGAYGMSNGESVDIDRLKKLNQPAADESVETKREATA